MKRTLTIDTANENGHRFGFNAITEIEEDFDLMDKIKQALSSQPEPPAMQKTAEGLELLTTNDLDSSQLIRLANYKLSQMKGKDYDGRSYLNGFSDGYASRPGNNIVEKTRKKSPIIGVQKGIEGYQAYFTIGNQTFHLDECVEETETESLELARWFERQLKIAFDKLRIDK